ncbi:hypothetical protein GOODEAATRI_019170, partial [Goodea atripinnis]
LLRDVLSATPAYTTSTNAAAPAGSSLPVSPGSVRLGGSWPRNAAIILRERHQRDDNFKDPESEMKASLRRVDHNPLREPGNKNLRLRREPSHALQ